MTRQELLKLSGLELFQRQVKALKAGKITYAHLRATSEAWLRHRGYMPTSLGWYEPEELQAMGAVQDEAGDWVIGTQERQRFISKSCGRVAQTYSVAEKATAYFARRWAQNATFAGLISAMPHKGQTLQATHASPTGDLNDASFDLEAL